MSFPWNRLSRTWLLTVGLLVVPVAASAVTVTGFVKTTANVAVGNVDIDVIDVCTGASVFIASDHTAADGSFSMSVPAGTYDIHFIPPFATTTLAVGDTQSVVIAGTTNLGTFRLATARLVSGTIRTPTNAPVANVDLKFLDAVTGERRFLTKTVSDASGNWSVRVPAGTWDIDFRPATGSPYADGTRYGVVVGSTTDVTGLLDNLKSGLTVSGSVRGKNKFIPANADISMYDECTGRTVPTSHDNVDALGNFSVVVPAGTYTFSISPTRCQAIASYRQANVSVSTATNMGQITLQDAYTVSGRVLAPNGQPLPRARLKFYDVTGVSAVRVGVAFDRTDTLGNFSCLVEPGTYDVNVEAPVGTNALVYHINNLVVGVGPVFTGDLQMVAGTVLSGHVTANGGGPADNVNINVIEHVTRVSQRIAHDATDEAGNFVLYVNPGTYDIHYEPQICSGLAVAQQDSVIVAGNTALPTANVVTGIHMTGAVRDTALFGVANVDLDVYPTGTATKLFTPTGTTAATGNYDLLLPPGTYDINFIPPSASRCRTGRRTGVVLATTGAQSQMILSTGRFVSATVIQDGTFLPIPNAVVEFYKFPFLGTPLYVAHRTTSLLGAFNCSVDPGTYDVRVIPPVGTTYIESWVRGVVVAGDTPLGNIALRFENTTGIGPSLGAGLRLGTPSPNPSRAAVSFTFSAPDEDAELTAWDVTGRKVATLWRGRTTQPVTIRWDGRSESGQRLPAGLYLVRLNDRRGQSMLRHVTLLH